MLQNAPPKATNAFMDPAAVTMADLIAMVARDEDLTPERRRNLASSIRRFCAALGYDPAQVPADMLAFKERLRRFHPLSAGIKKKRWQTIKADVTFALHYAGFTKGNTRGLAPLTPGWLAFKASDPSPQFMWGFARLAHFCSAAAIEPPAVNDRVIADFTAALDQETFKTNTSRLLRELCVRWNKIGATVPALGLQRLTEPSFRKSLTQRWDLLPPSLTREADDWLHSMSQEADLFSGQGRTKPLRPASITSYRYSIRQAVAGLVASGKGLQDIDRLAVLIAGDNPKLILSHFHSRNGGKTSSMICGIAHILVLIAEFACGADEAVIKKLKHHRSQLRLTRDGLRPRPKKVLSQFVDPANIEKILRLPIRIYEQLLRKTDLARKDALLMQAAVALELLLMRPIRRKNLVELGLDQNVIRVGKEILINIPSDEVKNDIELNHRLPPESAELLNFYIKRLLPLLGPNPKNFLFPGATGEQHKCGEELGRNFTKTIREMTGLHFYPHVVRHFGAFLYLKENPGAFEVVRRVLAHKSLETTTRSYVGFENEAAVGLYDRVILRIREACSEVDQDDGHE